MPMRLLRKNQVKSAEERQRDDHAQHLDRRQRDRPECDRRVADRQRQRARLAAHRDRRQPAQDGAEADGRHDDGDDRPAEQRPQHDALEREAEQDHDRDRGARRPPMTGMPLSAERERGNEARQHHELALREVDGVGGLVDQHEAERDQRVHQPDRQPADGQRNPELQLIPHHALLRHVSSRSLSPGPARGSAEAGKLRGRCLTGGAACRGRLRGCGGASGMMVAIRMTLAALIACQPRPAGASGGDVVDEHASR